MNNLHTWSDFVENPTFIHLRESREFNVEWRDLDVAQYNRTALQGEMKYQDDEISVIDCGEPISPLKLEDCRKLLRQNAVDTYGVNIRTLENGQKNNANIETSLDGLRVNLGR